jgi:hypothetical protein
MVSMLLDLVEVTKSHSGLNLTATFAKILNDFGIGNKVSMCKSHAHLKRLTPQFQILSITCNNASNNDKMIDKLEEILTKFGGSASQTCCFAHIINLIAKTIISQFDIPKSKDDTLSNEVMKELKELARDIKAEKLMTRASKSKEDEKDNEDDDNMEGWVDEHEEMEEWELEALDGDVQPV